jgi:hypothetical protein
MSRPYIIDEPPISGLNILRDQDKAGVTGTKPMPGRDDSRATVAKPNVRIVGSEEAEPYTGRSLSIDELYSALEEITPEMASALRLLAEGVKHVETALGAAKVGEFRIADDALNHLQVLMPELFCCRAIGDSYGTVINSLMNALRNRAGALNAIQIETIYLTMRELRDEPVMRYEKALDLVDRLEDHDLNLDPPGFEKVVALLDD